MKKKENQDELKQKKTPLRLHLLNRPCVNESRVSAINYEKFPDFYVLFTGNFPYPIWRKHTYQLKMAELI